MVERATFGTLVDVGTSDCLKRKATEATLASVNGRKTWLRTCQAYVKWGGIELHDAMKNAHREARRLSDASARADSELLGLRTYVNWN
jgi:hypothetical protein